MIFILGSILYAIVLGCVFYIYEDRVKTIMADLKDEKERHATCCNLRINSEIMVAQVGRNKQLIIDALRKDISEINSITASDIYILRSKICNLEFDNENLNNQVKFGNDRINNMYNSVYYDPKSDTVILLDDLTKIGEL